jgi:radical SAM-linked protein
MTFTLPLSLGHESLCESFDFRLEEEMTEQQILKAMEGTLPDGIILTAAGAPDYDASRIKYALYRIKMYGEKAVLKQCISHFEENDEIIVTKQSKKKTTDINIKAEIKNLKVVEETDDSLTFTALFPAGTTYNLNPSLLLEYFGNVFGVDANGCDVLRVNLLDEKLEILQ